MSLSYRLRHFHLRNLTPYRDVEALQQSLVAKFLSHKKDTSSNAEHGTEFKFRPRPAPTPTIITFSPYPVYTTGRREVDTLSPLQIAKLTEPGPDPSPTSREQTRPPVAEIIHTLRGGQITFHGPGQLVIYPILDLRSVKTEKWPNGLSVRCYVNLLEQTTINTIAKFGIHGVRTENPGVWLTDEPKGERKIAALGVHLRRNITSYGVGLNISTDLRWFDRIVGCGLIGKGTTRINDELDLISEELLERGEISICTEKVSTIWTKEFCKGIWGESGPESVSKAATLKDLLDKEGNLLEDKSVEGVDE